MSPLDLENWDFLAIHRAFCCCVFSLSGFYTAARCAEGVRVVVTIAAASPEVVGVATATVAAAAAF